jgi:hypothetical protein
MKSIKSKQVPIRLSVSLLAFLFAATAFGAAKAPATTTCNAGPTTTKTPQPVRSVVLGPVGTKIFALPNGSANLGADLQVLMLSAVAASNNFAPTDQQATYPCQEHIEVRAAVSSFQLDVVDFGISIGYTPNGGLGPVSGINGKAAVKVGTIAMDFSVWSCNSTGCSAIAASTSNHSVASGQLSFTLDFGAISTGPSLIVNSPLANIFRAIMADGMNKLGQSLRINDLPWQARVRDVTPSVGSIVFDAGTQDRLGVNQAFEVFAPTDASSTGGCNVFQAVATAHTVSVNAVSSTALIDSSLDARGVQVGDIVMIRTVKP